MPKVVGQDQSIAKRYTCRKCGAINEVVPNEIRKLWESKDYSGGSDGAEGFNCAACAGEVITRSW